MPLVNVTPQTGKTLRLSGWMLVVGTIINAIILPGAVMVRLCGPADFAPIAMTMIRFFWLIGIVAAPAAIMAGIVIRTLSKDALEAERAVGTNAVS